MLKALKRALRLLLLLVLLALAAGAWLAYDGRQQLNAPLHLPQAQTIEIVPHSRVRDVIGQLSEQGLLANRRQALYWEAYARLSHQAERIKTGEYRLDPGITPYQALALWISGKTVNYELRFVEGARFDLVLQQIAQHPQIQHTINPLNADTVMTALGHTGQLPEGRLFPDTYLFPKNTTDISLLRRAYGAMDQALKAEWATRADGLPYANPDEALIMASIVEKETGLASERPQIAGVFVRRLQKGMKLQTDPTVIYGLGASFDGNLRRRDLESDTPYNSYTRYGLPPSPICLPGRAAIYAALHPAEGDALFFVARGNGSHQFSATLEQHEAAVRQFQLGHRPASGTAPAPAADTTQGTVP